MRRPTLPAMSRTRWRTVLLCVGVLPALVAVLFTAMVLRMLVLQHSGNGEYAGDRFLDAAGHYRSAGHHNLLEDWIAAFDAGAARHAQGQYHAAIKAYDAALHLGVPHRDECTVRINMALGYEAVGDAATAQKKLDAANDAYQSGIKALEDGKCHLDAGRGPDQTKDGKAVDDRLHKKLQQNQQKKKQQRQQKQQQSKKNKKQRQKQQQQQQRKQQQEKQRERKLQQQNQQGLKQRKEQQDREGGFGYQPSW